MGVIDFYRGKSVLLTGTTGFIGKVCLEKFLRVIPDVGRIYILIRKKKGLNTMERFKKEILGSKCFDRVRKQVSNFDQLIDQKIRPVEGDLLKDGLGLSEKDAQELTENLQVIINCAASIDFNARLDEAIEMNIFGTLRMFELAKKCRHLQNFLHVSTAYVNADKRGLIEEKIYEISFDAEKLVSDLYKMPKDQLVSETPRIIGHFPNTYTFTKSLVEKILLKNRGDLTLTILRPSIVGVAWRDPYLGWVDSVSAASAVFLLAGIGVVKYIEGDPAYLSDQVPVDFVADAMIVAAATYANCNKFTVVHSTSSSRNGIVAINALSSIKNYWRAHPPEKRVGPCNVALIKDPKLVQIQRYTQTIPTKVYASVARVVGTPSMKKNAEKLKKIMIRTQTVSELFSHFTKNEWIFATDRIDEMRDFCTRDELKEFQLDITQVDWEKYFQYFGWGLHHYVLGEKVEYPTNNSERMDLLATLQHKNYFQDIAWAFNNGQNFKPSKQSEMKSYVLNSARLKNTIQELVSNRKNKAISEEKYAQQLMTKASDLCNKLMSTYSMPLIKLTAAFINILVRNMYEKIVVDETSLSRLAQLDFKAKGPVVLLPSHRSFVDFILISYISFVYKLKCPHIGAYDHFLEMAFLPWLFRACGGFFMQKDKRERTELYQAILYEYLQKLMLEESWLELFLEESRSKFGKALPPNYNLLSIVTDAYFDKKVPDVQLVPITINYERVAEADTFPFELLGEEKLQLSTRKLLRSYKKLSSNFGKVFVKFCEPISLKNYVESSQTQGNPFSGIAPRKALVENLGLDVMRKLNDNLIIMPTSIVASILLMRRKGIAEEQLVKKTEWLISEIRQRKGIVGTDFAHVAVKTALFHLKDLTERKKDIFHPSFSAKNTYKNTILLSYYRNMLLHVFFQEAVVTCALVAFGYELAWKDGVTIERLWESTSFLGKLVRKEYYTTSELDQSQFQNLLTTMISRETFQLQDNKIKVSPKGEELVSYLCSLLWPFIESYWSTSVFLYTLKNRDQNTSLEKFESELQGFAESMYEERVIQFYESCSIDTIRNALMTFKECRIISCEEKFNDETKQLVEVLNLACSEAQLKELVDNIHKYMKNSLASTMELPINMAKRTVLIDYPFMSKL